MKTPVISPRHCLRLPTFFVLLLASQSLLLSGCSSHSALMVQQVEQQTGNQQKIQQVMEALKITEARVAVAQSNNVDVYAPTQMAVAKDALAEARRYSDRFQADPDNVNRSISLFFGDSMGDKALALIAKANTALEQAENNKQQADAIFGAANENFVWLKTFQAPAHFTDEYEELERTQQRLIEYVADGNPEAARQGLPRLLKEQRSLEIAAAQRFYLNDLTQNLARANGGTVDRFAPLSYSAAIGALNQANGVIAQNPRDEAAVLQAKANAEFSFAVAGAVATDMQNLSTMDHREMERWLILLETKLFELGTTLGAADVRDHPLLQQLQLLTEASNQRPLPAQQEQSLVAATPATDEATPAAEPPAEQAIDQRMSQLEQSLSEQIKALSEQLQDMKSANQNAQVSPAYQASPTYQAPQPTAEPARRQSLFGY